LALSAEEDAKSRCNAVSGICPTGDSSLRARALRLETLAIGLDVIGAVAAASGLTMIMVSAFSETTAAVAPYLAPGALGLSGRF
jgi:hypothetical protein